VANSDYRELIRPTLDALADEDVLVVVSTGRRPVESLGLLPANARVAEYLPYDLLFPKLAAFVTNGGYGGLQFALQHGVPIVAAGTSEDKLETTARVQWSGAGIGLATNHPTEAVLRRAVRRVLEEDSFRVTAQRLGAEIAASPGLAGVDDAVAELTAAGRTSRIA
jgi:UDP:flavonoid glycosyltransferase YjiC (YdhE family)